MIDAFAAGFGVWVWIFFEIVLDKERILKSGMMLVEDSTRILKD
jgi:hypothetical protein